MAASPAGDCPAPRSVGAERSWFVSYDLTARSIVLQYDGDDEHQITPSEARALSEELFAATVAANEHAVLLGETDGD